MRKQCWIICMLHDCIYAKFQKMKTRLEWQKADLRLLGGGGVGVTMSGKEWEARIVAGNLGDGGQSLFWRW